jgi:rare lipoprotein A
LQYTFMLTVLIAVLASIPALASTASENPATSPRQTAAHTGAQTGGQIGAKPQVGTASHYGRGRAGRLTASGERFNPNAMTCAHRTLPLGSVVKVTDIATGKHVSVKVNDRGPFVRGRILDLSDRAARELGVGGRGLLHVSVEVTDAAPPGERG